MFAQHLPSFDWNPIILAVHEDFYEEKLDWNLHQLLPSQLRIEKVNAFKTTKPRLIGDIGLRGFFQLYKRAKQLIEDEHIDFLHIPVPSFYVSLLGRWLHHSTGIKYGIDYIDPWVHRFPGSDKIFSRHWFTTQIAKFLEPIAVKKASLITGVAEGYYKGVQDRNPDLVEKCVFAAMPYGGERADHDKVESMHLKTYLFEKKPGKIQLVYAGAMLPKAYAPLDRVFTAIANYLDIFTDLEIHFIGTGNSANFATGFNIKPIAQKYGLWQRVIFEYPARIPYLDVLVHLNAATGVFILGSTEPHYTPSKVYQGVLSKKPIWAVLHAQSTACAVLAQAGAGVVLEFDGEADLDKISKTLRGSWQAYQNFSLQYDFPKVNKTEFKKYSAENVTAILAESIEKASAMQ
ncbi:hypothetical protein SAE01_01220 [Segetibacter aerophilus]|uniref:Glycosyltransferase subfamily 4-like N-terminal domain-containing protein n=1 Tax=Segetibacter aerophilus TaxID=670293 RepID=A0A512B6P1_9BACT|nr:hypothetical protein SAE01_01220 [Segetibacter aerophilus]